MFNLYFLKQLCRTACFIVTGTAYKINQGTDGITIISQSITDSIVFLLLRMGFQPKRFGINK